MTFKSYPKPIKGEKKKPKKHHEDDLQKACVSWFRMQYSKDLIFSIPNGAVLAGTPLNRAIQMARLKSTGLVVGIPDLFIAKANKISAGMFIELKVKPNKPSVEQKAIIHTLQIAGYEAVVIYDLETFIEVVNDYMK